MKNLVRRNNKSGFTIVELLIVIVVIAILAAISIVAYNGIQQRANNAQRIAAAQQWIKDIKAYVSTNGSYPSSQAQMYCIGTSNPTDLDANPDVDCGLSNNVKHDSAQTTIFNQGISTISTLPNFPGKAVDFGTFKAAGMLYRSYDTFDPTGKNIANYPTLTFALEGANQDCGVGPLATSFSGGDFAQATGKYSLSQGNGTGCRVMLVDPSAM